MPDLPLAIRPNPTIVPPIVHEEPDFLIIDKPAGLVTQPGKGHASDSLLNGIFALNGGFVGKLLHNLGVRRDFGLLHRLDKDTSGLLVVAKTPNAYDQLRRDFEDRHVDKEYLALTAGIPAPPQGVIQARLKEVQVPNPAPGWGGGGGGAAPSKKSSFPARARKPLPSTASCKNTPPPTIPSRPRWSS